MTPDTPDRTAADAIALHDRAILTHHAGRYAEAESLLRQALTLAPNHLLLLRSFGQMLREQGRVPDALHIFLQVLALDPKDADVWNAAGVCFQETGQPAKAMEFYLRAMALRPDLAEPYNNLGVVLLREHDLDAAVEHFEQAIALRPDYAEAWSNIAIAHRDRLDYNAAIAAFRRTFDLLPGNAEIAAGLGEILSLVYHPDAEPVLRHALALEPHNAERHWNLSLELLKQGRYREGFAEYEWRWQRPERRNPMRPFAQPFWRNQPGQTLRGKTILLHAEQGFGDTLQMLRYVPLVQALGARIVLEVQAPLKQLVSAFASTLPQQLTVIAHGEPLPPFDVHAAMMSLPLAFATDRDTVPPPIRLTPPALRLHHANEPVRVGLCWSGNPSHARDRERSIALETLRPLLQTPGCRWVSLQTGPAAAQIAALGLQIDQPQLTDFAATAAVIDTLDLVIAVDTAVAHLAATQGVPTWILLPFVADWRWLQPPSGTRPADPNPWYPQARIFRQRHFPSARDPQAMWNPVIAETSAALRHLIAAAPTPPR